MPGNYKRDLLLLLYELETRRTATKIHYCGVRIAYSPLVDARLAESVSNTGGVTSSDKH